jgi:hypothetical protein
MVVQQEFNIVPSYRSHWMTTGLNQYSPTNGQPKEVYTGNDLVENPSELGGRWFSKKKSKKSKRSKRTKKSKRSKRSKKVLKKGSKKGSKKYFGSQRLLTVGGISTQDSWGL